MSDTENIPAIDTRNRRVKRNFKKRLNYKEALFRSGQQQKRIFNKPAPEPDIKAEFAEVSERYRILLLRRKEQEKSLLDKKNAQDQDLLQYKMKKTHQSPTKLVLLPQSRERLLTYLKHKFC